MRAILVLGSIENDDKLDLFRELCSQIGRKIIEMGYMVINGGTDFNLHVDKYVAEAAQVVCNKKDYDLNNRILAVVREGSNPHGIGISLSVKGEVDSEKRMSLIQRAHAIIVIGGSTGTKEYMVLGELTKKPIIPIPIFKGIGGEYFYKYINNVPSYFPKLIEKDDFDLLNQVITSDDTLKSIAENAVNLAKKSFSESNYIFIAMPLAKEFDNIFRAIKSAVVKVNEESDEIQYICERIDEGRKPTQIDIEIEEKIKKAKIVIADLSESNPNVYYEFGLARGKDIIVINIAKKGTILPFDIRQHRTEFYDLSATNITDLENDINNFADNLKECIKSVSLARISTS